jgi:hypothetical protein
MITQMTMAGKGLGLAAGRGFTPLAERRSPDPARRPSLDSRRVGAWRSNCNAVPHAHAGTWRVSVCDHLDTIVTGQKNSREISVQSVQGPIFSYSHVYSCILSYSHIKKYNFFCGEQMEEPMVPAGQIRHCNLGVACYNLRITGYIRSSRCALHFIRAMVYLNSNGQQLSLNQFSQYCGLVIYLLVRHMVKATGCLISICVVQKKLAGMVMRKPSNGWNGIHSLTIVPA